MTNFTNGFLQANLRSLKCSAKGFMFLELTMAGKYKMVAQICQIIASDITMLFVMCDEAIKQCYMSCVTRTIGFNGVARGLVEKKPENHRCKVREMDEPMNLVEIAGFDHCVISKCQFL